jgi:HAMP domain-containing protein
MRTTPMNKNLNAKKPLKIKLMQSSLLLLAVTFLIVSTLVFLGIDKVSTGIVELVEKRSVATKEKLTTLVSESSQRIEKDFTDDIISQAVSTLKKDSATLAPIFQDNSFAQVREFITGVFKNDKDILRASFFVNDGDRILMWHHVDRMYPKGTDLGMAFNKKKMKWTGKYKDKPVEIDDDFLSEIIRSNTVRVVETKYQSGKDSYDVIETYIPVIKPFIDLNQLQQEVIAARKQKAPIGYLRYTISVESLRKHIAQERKVFSENIEQIEGDNKKTAQETKTLGMDLRNNILFMLAGAILGLLVMSFFFTQYLSTRVTAPINRLIEVASRITQGEYKQDVSIQTDDEVGILADTIQRMSDAIVKRDEELAEFNRGLESLVLQRTEQLHVEMGKVKNLLDSMRQAVFTVGSELKVIGPTSKFSKEIFQEDITGQHLNNLLLKAVDPKSEMYSLYKTVMVTVFGEDSLQWMLMEDNLPKEMVLDIYGKEKIVEIGYNPLFDKDGRLHQIMYIVQDVTVERELKHQIEIERKKNQEKGQILEELSCRTPEEIKSFFSAAYRMLEQSLILSSNEETYAKNRLDIFRNFHTLKGNSKVLGFEKLAILVHRLEHEVSPIIDQPTNLSLQLIKIRDLIKQNLECVNGYSHVAESIFHIPNEAFTNRLKDLHGQFMSLTSNSQVRQNLVDAIDILSPFLSQDLKNGRKYEKVMVWLQNEVLKRGLVETASLNPHYLRKVPRSMKKIISLCEYYFRKNHSIVIGDYIGDLSLLRDLYDDLFRFKEFMDAVPRHEVKSKLSQFSFKLNILNDCFQDISNETPSDYVFAIRCFEVLNTYIASDRSSDFYSSGMMVYSDNFDRIRQNIMDLLPQDTFLSVDVLLKRVENLPLKKSFERYFSLVEDVSKRLGKKARLAIHGQELYLPRASLDLINDCLVHLIRNSLDHGLEKSNERTRMGKSEVGTISISIQEHNQKLKIVVEDDGRGSDPESLRQKLVAKGIYSQQRVNELTNQEVAESIFLPEFSTQDEASDISGRGVGMSAVKVIVEKELQGNVSFSSVSGRGSIFSIEIPTTEFLRDQSIKQAG